MFNVFEIIAFCWYSHVVAVVVVDVLLLAEFVLGRQERHARTQFMWNCPPLFRFALSFMFNVDQGCSCRHCCRHRALTGWGRAGLPSRRSRWIPEVVAGVRRRCRQRHPGGGRVRARASQRSGAGVLLITYVAVRAKKIENVEHCVQLLWRENMPTKLSVYVLCCSGKLSVTTTAASDPPIKINSVAVLDTGVFSFSAEWYTGCLEQDRFFIWLSMDEDVVVRCLGGE